MKRLLSVIVGILSLLPLSAREFEYTYEGQTINYKVVDETAGTVEVASNKVSGVVVIPDFVKDSDKTYVVKGIGIEAFMECAELTSVTIPDSVTVIGQAAFLMCRTLESFKGGSGVSQIGGYAFYGCGVLPSFSFGDRLTKIGAFSFMDCTGFTELNISDSVCEIGAGAFAYCTKVSDVKFGKSVKVVGSDAFTECYGLSKVDFPSFESLCQIDFQSPDANPVYYTHKLYINSELVTEANIPEGVEAIGEYVFCGCTQLQSVTIPASVTRIGAGAFYGCTGLKNSGFASLEALCRIKFIDECSNPLTFTHKLIFDGIEVSNVVVPESVTELNNAVFSGCVNLKSVIFPGSLTSIGNDAFSMCTSLKEIDIPDAVQSIGSYAFNGCYSLERVSIGRDMAEIGYAAFRSCFSLKTLLLPDSPISFGADVFVGCGSLSKVEVASIESLCKMTFWTEHSNPIYQSERFYIDGEEVTEVIIPETISEIDAYTFVNCRNMTSVTFPKTLKTIGFQAFAQCTGLTSVKMESVEQIDGRAFENCTGLSTVYLPDNLKSVWGFAFSGCSSMTNVYCAAQTPPTIKESAFEDTNTAEATLHVPTGKRRDYLTWMVWRDFGTIIDDITDGVDDVMADKAPEGVDFAMPYEVYNLNGQPVGNTIDNLSKGLYLVRQNNVVKKISVD